jgi:hypothetical protein
MIGGGYFGGGEGRCDFGEAADGFILGLDSMVCDELRDEELV